MKAAITVIRPGLSKNNRYYPESVLKRDFKIFEGVKMFADHASEKAEREYPGGQIGNWVANLRNVRAEADGTLRGEAVIIDTPFKEKLSALAKNNLLEQFGVSIRAYGRGSVREVEGVGKVNFVEALEKAESVDFVTRPAAGGKVESLAESDGHIVESTGFIESFNGFRAAESIGEFRELNALVAKIGRRRGTFYGDEETVQQLVNAGFSYDAAQVLMESADPKQEFSKWSYDRFWDALKGLK